MTLETIFEKYDAEQMEQTEQEIEHSDVQNDEEMTSDYPEDGMSELAHIGVKFRSGRFPYGSGERPHQHLTDANGNDIENIFRFDDGSYDWKTVHEMTTDFSTGMNATQSMYNDMRKYMDPANKTLPKTNFLPKAKKMSDEDIRAAIARMKLEKEYNSMMQELNPPKRKISEQKLMKALAIGGGLVTAGVGVANLVNSITQTNMNKQEMANKAAKELEKRLKDKELGDKKKLYMDPLMDAIGFNDPILVIDPKTGLKDMNKTLNNLANRSKAAESLKKLSGFIDSYGEFI